MKSTHCLLFHIRHITTTTLFFCWLDHQFQVIGSFAIFTMHLAEISGCMLILDGGGSCCISSRMYHLFEVCQWMCFSCVGQFCRMNNPHLVSDSLDSQLLQLCLNPAMFLVLLNYHGEMSEMIPQCLVCVLSYSLTYPHVIIEDSSWSRKNIVLLCATFSLTKFWQ